LEPDSALGRSDPQVKDVRDNFVQFIEIKESLLCPSSKYGIIIAAFGATTLITLIIGDPNVESAFNIERCSPAFWIWSILYIVVILSIAFFAALIVAKEQVRPFCIPKNKILDAKGDRRLEV
jgi:hypothetical protein